MAMTEYRVVTSSGEHAGGFDENYDRDSMDGVVRQCDAASPHAAPHRLQCQVSELEGDEIVRSDWIDLEDGDQRA